MKTVTIYGSSDDLIEVEGDIREEFGMEKGFLYFDDGSIVSVQFSDKGQWKCILVCGPARIVEYLPVEEADEDDYSDHLTIKGEFTSVDCWHNNPPTTDEIAERINDFFQNWATDDLTADQITRIHKIIKE